MDLSTSYAGLQLTSPIIVGASPLALDPDHLKAFAQCGAGAVVMPSIFEEQINHSDLLRLDSAETRPSTPHLYPDLLTYRPQLDNYNGGTEGYLRHIESAKQQAGLPILANVNCMTTGPWMKYAARIEEAGADAVELNLYHDEADPQRFADDIERELLERVRAFCSATNLGVSVKILSRFTSLANMVFRMAGAGAKSVCLFGQVPSIGLDDKDRKSYGWSLTTNSELRVALEGIQSVRGTVHNLTVAACGGIQNSEDAIASLRLGADAVMMTSAIYKQGIEVLKTIHDSIEAHMQERGIGSLEDLVGADVGGFDPYANAYRRRVYTSSLINLSDKIGR